MFYNYNTDYIDGGGAIMANHFERTDEAWKDGLLLDGSHKSITRQEAERIVLQLPTSEKIMLAELLKVLEPKRYPFQAHLE